MPKRICITCIILVTIFGCSVDPEIPCFAKFTIFPSQGDTITLFLFDATSSIQNQQDGWRLKVRWDWESDGIWDTDFSLDKTATHRFQYNGEKLVRLEVADVTGTKDTTSKSILVSKLIKDSIITDSRDGKTYRVKYINNIWWMTQDLAFGQIMQNKKIPTDNGIVERWVFPDSVSTLSKQQGFYTQLEASNYYKNVVDGICPEGWKIPTSQDCAKLNSFFWNQWNSFVLNDSITYELNPAYHGFFYLKTSMFHDTLQSNYYWIRQADKDFSFAQFNQIGFGPAYWNNAMESQWENKLGIPFNRLWLGFALRCIKK